MKAYEPHKTQFEFWVDMEMILSYLNANGKLNITPKRVEELYEGYSEDVWCASWMGVNEDILEDFANWLSEIEVDKN